MHPTPAPVHGARPAALTPEQIDAMNLRRVAQGKPPVDPRTFAALHARIHKPRRRPSPRAKVRRASPHRRPAAKIAARRARSGTPPAGSGDGPPPSEPPAPTSPGERAPEIGGAT